jgi:hypothetical protein
MLRHDTACVKPFPVIIGKSTGYATRCDGLQRLIKSLRLRHFQPVGTARKGGFNRMAAA